MRLRGGIYIYVHKRIYATKERTGINIEAASGPTTSVRNWGTSTDDDEDDDDHCFRNP